MPYSFKGVNISNLIQSGGSSVVPGYTGFSTSIAPTYTTTGLDKPYNFSYSFQGTDASQYATAYNLSYSTAGNGTISIAIGNTGYSFKHISAYCWGGGGGGGGGGGNNNTEGGGDGGTGGDGAFAAIIDYPIENREVRYTVGSAGNGGAGGKGKFLGPTANSGSKGGPGGTSILYVGSSNSNSIIFANGGGGGNGGSTGETSGKAPNGSSGDNGNASYSAGYTGTTSNTSPSTSYPNNQSNGSGGGNGEYDNPKSAGDGSTGYIRVYLTYQ
jgi:hypothetical protein